MAHVNVSTERVGAGRHNDAVRVCVAALVALLPPVLALAFVKVTSSPRDANVGGALYVALGIIVGLTLAAVYVARSARRRR